MATVPVFICPNCGSEDCILEFIEKAGHKIPGLWHCDKCSWEGKMRECIWTEVIPGVPTHVPVREAPAVVPIRISITSLGTATPEPETPSSQSTCPVACPHCGEKLVEIWVRHTSTLSTDNLKSRHTVQMHHPDSRGRVLHHRQDKYSGVPRPL